jgi:hypothetical protein
MEQRALAGLNAALARVAELEAALKPFALAYGNPGDYQSWVTQGMLRDARCCFPELDRAALQSSPDAAPEPSEARGFSTFQPHDMPGVKEGRPWMPPPEPSEEPLPPASNSTARISND